jgi:hypothetical protein
VSGARCFYIRGFTGDPGVGRVSGGLLLVRAQARASGFPARRGPVSNSARRFPIQVVESAVQPPSAARRIRELGFSWSLVVPCFFKVPACVPLNDHAGSETLLHIHGPIV